MYKVMVFAGTTEGREICRFLSEYRIPSWASAATEYGGRSLEAGEFLKVHTGRLTETEMENLFLAERPELVVDATHPYAAEVTLNIQKACEQTETSYVRVLRESEQGHGQAVWVENTREAVKFLNGTEGNVLLTTGSKELSLFTELPNYQERLYARVLSLPAVLESCKALGLEGKHLIGMQGPFSKEMNAATLRQYECRWLVTKDTGNTGGFQEKLEAARECGATPVIIGRPLKEKGISLRECRKQLAERFGLSLKPEVTLLGIGMGNRDTLTLQGAEALKQAELLIGARRVVDAVRLPEQDVFYEYGSEEIAAYIQSHGEYERIVVVLSGDVGFYSGARKLLERLGADTRVICGISSVVYFMARIGLSWEDARIVSSHGRSCNLVSLIRNNQKVFALLGTGEGVAELARKLTDYGMEKVRLYVGENLSYPNETVFFKTAGELTEYQGERLSVVCAWNPEAVPPNATHGISDEAFIRGKTPMTKEEVRAVSLAKLQLKEDSICYDVGAGTGSVAVEMALRAWAGKVYAIEKKEEALELIRENKRKFAADNLEIISGMAPEVLKELPPPTHAFVGGSSGNLKEILKVLQEKNPRMRMVINCITLETVSEALEAIRELDLEGEIVQVSAARGKALGRYHLMMGENPIYIFTCQPRADRTQEE